MHALSVVAAVLSGAVAVIGLAGIAAPTALLDIGRSLQAAPALYVVSAIRIVFGALLAVVAPASRMPRTLRALGVVIIAAGVLTPLFGVERAQMLLDGWAARGPWLTRAASAVALAFGIFITWAVLSPSGTTRAPLTPLQRPGKSMSDDAAALAAALIRNINEVPLQPLTREPHYDSRSARLARGTAARKLGASIDVLAPGKRGCPYHLHHAQEEMFVVLEGHGTLRVAGEMLALKPGDVIFIPAGPEYPHQIINTSDAPLRYLSISTMETPEICEYPDSGKFLAEGSLDRSTPFEAIGRTGASLDYWDREP